MLSERQLEELTEPLMKLYQDMEMELLLDVIERFDRYETVGGSLEWRLRKLDELGILQAQTVKTIARYSQRSEEEIEAMLSQASMGNWDLEAVRRAQSLGELVSTDLEALTRSPVLRQTLEHAAGKLRENLRLIETHALESARQDYLDILNQAYLETSGGIYSYSESISRGVRKMVQQGITGASYQRSDGTVRRMGIEAVVRRDTLTAVNQTANESVLQLSRQLGAQYVEVSSHLGARVSTRSKIANHAGWQGKIYRIEGADEQYGNLIEETGYGTIEGLAGINCRHRMFPFFPGISQPAQVQYDSEENRKAYALSQKQRAMERRIRSLKKEMAAMKALGDDAGLKQARTKQRKAVQQLEQFCQKNGLRRDGTREQIE